MDTGKLTTPMVIHADGVKFLDPSGNVILQMGNLESSVEKRYLIVQEANIIEEPYIGDTYFAGKRLSDANKPHKVWLLIVGHSIDGIYWRRFNRKYINDSLNHTAWVAEQPTKELELFAILRGLL